MGCLELERETLKIKNIYMPRTIQRTTDAVKNDIYKTQNLMSA